MKVVAIIRRMESVDQALEEARQAGIDLDLLDTNLALSVKERWEQHDGALALALKLQTAGKLKDARLQSSASSTL